MKTKTLAQNLGFITIPILLAISLVVNGFFVFQQPIYTFENLPKQLMDLECRLANLKNQSTGLQNQNTDLVGQLEDLEDQGSVLSEKIDILQDEKFRLLEEKRTLQNQLSLLNEQKIPPKLVTRLGATDMRYNYSGQDLRLYITGEVCNVGTETAFNSTLHVTLYQGIIIAADTYIPLGDLAGGSFTSVARNIYYTGDALTNWTIVPEHS